MLVFLGAKYLILLVHILRGFKAFRHGCRCWWRLRSSLTGGRCFKRSNKGLPEGSGASSVKNFEGPQGEEVHCKRRVQEDMFLAPRTYTDRVSAANRGSLQGCTQPMADTVRCADVRLPIRTSAPPPPPSRTARGGAPRFRGGGQRRSRVSRGARSRACRSPSPSWIPCPLPPSRPGPRCEAGSRRPGPRRGE